MLNPKKQLIFASVVMEYIQLNIRSISITDRVDHSVEVLIFIAVFSELG